MQLAEDGGTQGPELWFHRQDGSLAWAFRHGSGPHGWCASEVRKIAERWRRSERTRAPSSVAVLVDTHRRFARIAEEAGLGLPDEIVHDLARSEVRAIWTDPELEVVIDEVPESRSADDR
jgi:hypothetical protein